MKNKGHKITAVAPGSIGEELELEPGDVLLTIDGEEIEDIFDYDYMTDSESFVMTVAGKPYTERKEAGRALMKEILTLVQLQQQGEIHIARIGGFDLVCSAESSAVGTITTTRRCSSARAPTTRSSCR